MFSTAAVTLEFLGVVALRFAFSPCFVPLKGDPDALFARLLSKEVASSHRRSLFAL